MNIKTTNIIYINLVSWFKDITKKIMLVIIIITIIKFYWINMSNNSAFTLN